jgi:DNA-binding MarR family transcriptional regulator
LEILLIANIPGRKIMSNNSYSPPSPEAVKLLQQLLHPRSHIHMVVPENIRAVRERVYGSNFSDKAGRVAGPLLYLAAEVLIHYEGPISMGEFSRYLEVPFSTATRTMDWLVNNGYAQRLPDPNDRRIVLVELTQAGKETYHLFSSFLLERVEQALSRLTPTERETFIELFNKVLNAFEEAA